MCVIIRKNYLFLAGGEGVLRHLMSKKVGEIKFSKIRSFSQRALSVEGVVSLSIGQPDFHTPSPIKDAGMRAISNNLTTYPPTGGYPELLKAASHYMHAKYGFVYDPSTEILVTNGATEAIYIALTTLLDEGSEVILPAPVYPGYEPVIKLCGAKPVHIDTRDTGFKLTAEALRSAITDQTRCLILAYPMNPTGVTLDEEELHAIQQLLVDKNIFVISDEIYSELLYEGNHRSISQMEGMREKTIVINGLSKSHAMTGWRVGFTFAPAYITEQMVKVHQYAVTAISSISQYAAIEALTSGIDDVVPMKREYHRRRDYVYERLLAMGLPTVKPQGAFYFFPNITQFGQSSYDFALDLLEKAKVAVVPGDAFSTFGEGYIRLSYAYSMDNLKEALDRMEAFIGKRMLVN